MLTHKEAIKRFQQIQNNIDYEFTLQLSKKKAYKGLAKIIFICKESNNLFLDFRGKKIISLQINGIPQQSILIQKNFINGKIYLPSQSLKIQQQNEVVILYKNNYNSDQIGLYKYQDLQENIYLYTQSVPYDLNQVFPLFDQPDLKARMTLNLIIPRNWEVCSNELIDSIYDYQNIEGCKWQSIIEIYFKGLGVSKFVSFKKTQLLSTYLFAFIAGDYSKIKTNNKFNSEVFCQVDYDLYTKNDIHEIGSVIQESINYYQDFFGCPYPFSKCDLALVPNSKYQAMENPGIITYSDQSALFSKQQTIRDIENRRRTLSHEISHQWFGNLVTMKWWDNIWLNESFAEFCSYTCKKYLQEKIPYKNCNDFDEWLQFSEKKQWGYQEDYCSKTTHSIVQQINNTNEANTVFDGISYSKGAASLQQFYHLIGDQNFRLGLKRYFEKFQWKNTTLLDFIDIFQQLMKEKNINLDLIQWKNQWLETAGLNTIQTQHQDNKLQIRQGYYDEQYSQLRQHLITFSYFDEQLNFIQDQKILIQDIDIQIQELNINNCKYILPNSDDLTFIKLKLDNQESFFLKNIDKLNQIQQYQVLYCIYADVLTNNKKADDFLKLLVDFDILQKLQGSQQLFVILIRLIQEILYYTKRQSLIKDKVFEQLLLIFQDPVSAIPKTPRLPAIQKIQKIYILDIMILKQQIYMIFGVYVGYTKQIAIQQKQKKFKFQKKLKKKVIKKQIYYSVIQFNV